MQPKPSNNTTSFDILKATAEGYKFLWQRRKFIARLALLPIFVKFICYFVIINLDMDENFLRQGILLLPSYLIEGYLVCALVRIAVFKNEELITPPGSGAFEYYKQRGRDIQAGAVMYALIKLLSALVLGLMMSGPPVDREAIEPQDSSFEAFFAMFLAFIFFIWAFRLMWLNLPITLGYTMKSYMRRMRGISFSFHIFSVWVMCVIPFGLVTLLFSDVMAAMTGHSLEIPSKGYRFGMLSIQAVLDTMMVIVANVAIGLGIYWIMSGKNLENLDKSKKK